MILNRIRKVGNLNWKYAIGEILLIFIGISLSLMFDEWRTSRADRKSEKEVLLLLNESVKNDIEDLKTKITSSDQLLNTLKYFLG
jgi:hypothetical protein